MDTIPLGWLHKNNVAVQEKVITKYASGIYLWWVYDQFVAEGTIQAATKHHK